MQAVLDAPRACIGERPGLFYSLVFPLQIVEPVVTCIRVRGLSITEARLRQRWLLINISSIPFKES